DGHWSAAHFADRGVGAVESPGAGRPVRDLRATSLLVLTLLAEGVTPDDSSFGRSLRLGTDWLRSRLDEKGRIGLHDGPDWLLDHAIATYALCETARLTQQPEVRALLDPTLEALRTNLVKTRQSADTELITWSSMCARSAARVERDLPTESSERAGLSNAIDRLRTLVEELRPTDFPDSQRGRAAYLLLECMRWKARGPESTDADVDRLLEIAGPFLAKGWPLDMDDPLVVFYATIALYDLQSIRGGREIWSRVERRLTKSVIMTQLHDGDWKGTWDPQGEFSEDGGRMCTTAVHMLILQVYYRYSALDVVD
ncbi:MAG: hypothetical protein KDB80_16545, partial [Planctomycetes bacterium]|nr:hypothetical protein [Planctomycetota bacterium]